MPKSKITGAVSQYNTGRIGGGSLMQRAGRGVMLDEAATGGGTAVADPPAKPDAAGGDDLKAITDEVTKTVQQALEAGLESVNQTVQQQGETIAQLQERLGNPAPSDADRNRVNQMFGGAGDRRAPGVQTGESALSSRGYSVARAMGVKQGLLPRENAKYEIDVHERLHKLFVKWGQFTPERADSILMPMGSAYLGTIAQEAGDDGAQALAREIRQSFIAGVQGCDLDEVRWAMRRVNQTLSTFDDTAGAVFLGNTQEGEMIDILRNKEVMSMAGATQLSLPPNGRMSWPRHTGSATAYWVEEGGSITDSEFTTGIGLNLVAKKLAALVKIPNELIRFGTPSIEAFIRADIARVLALKADLAFLEGTGGGQPRGITTYTAAEGLNLLNATTTATDGDTLEPKDLDRMTTAVAQDNVDTTGWRWLLRHELEAQIINKRADAVQADDAAGPFLFPVNRSGIENGNPPSLRGYPMVKSNQISAARTKGAGDDLTYLLGGVFSEYLIGRVGVIEFASTQQGDTPFTTDQTWLRAIQHLDGGPRRTQAFSMIDKLVRTI